MIAAARYVVDDRPDRARAGADDLDRNIRGHTRAARLTSDVLRWKLSVADA